MLARSLHAAALFALLLPATSTAQPSSAVRTVEFEARSVGRTIAYNDPQNGGRGSGEKI